MATEDREMMEGRGAGESRPTFPKMVPDDPMPEGKSRASLPQEAESPKPDSSYDYLEEMKTCEDRGCPGPPKSLSSKAGAATTNGQAGDGPERAELPLAPAAVAPGTPGPQRNDEMELEKVRMEFELKRLKYLQEENEQQQQHEQVMEQLRQQATPRLFSGGLQDLLLPQNQFTMFLYCFIFIHIIYVTKEMIFFLFSKHYLFSIAAILLCLIKTLCSKRRIKELSAMKFEQRLAPSLARSQNLAPSCIQQILANRAVEFSRWPVHRALPEQRPPKASLPITFYFSIALRSTEVTSCLLARCSECPLLSPQPSHLCPPSPSAGSFVKAGVLTALFTERDAVPGRAPDIGSSGSELNLRSPSTNLSLPTAFLRGGRGAGLSEGQGLAARCSVSPSPPQAGSEPAEAASP
ncbi:LOW QUALITY PROTEIN: transmembrane protein 247 [Mesoplodon densirostris]|uniref:LOW QUALITY PROTEIN: transmembrane protein 247 n=1 Tax=Mesoplodon densirostris TaxID=48708 RepID=UPI0028DB7407|nr:LOW QUALITY PROTEIN: transmembrane protein 247 [Mesoplodon densirostris]